MFLGKGNPIYDLGPAELYWFVFDSGRELFKKRSDNKTTAAAAAALRSPIAAPALLAALAQLKLRAGLCDYYTMCNGVCPIEPMLARLACVRSDSDIFKDVDMVEYCTPLDTVNHDGLC